MSRSTHGITLLLVTTFAFGSAACHRGAISPAPSTAIAPEAASRPVVSYKRVPVEPRPEYSDRLDSAVSQSDLDELWSHELMVPVEGISPRTLRNDFSAPRSGTRGTHGAIDILAGRLTAVLAADDMVIGRMFSGPVGGIVIYASDLSGRFVYYYAHLDRYEPGLKVGDRVPKSTVVGYVGFTGNASSDAPHLHFQIMKRGAGRVWWDGPPINPITFLVLNGVRR